MAKTIYNSRNIENEGHPNNEETRANNLILCIFRSPKITFLAFMEIP